MMEKEAGGHRMAAVGLLGLLGSSGGCMCSGRGAWLR